MSENRLKFSGVAGMLLHSAGTPSIRTPLSIGSLANNFVSGPLAGLSGLLTAAAYIISVVLLISAIQKYQHHKHNPHEASLSSVIIYFLLALAMFLVPLAHHLASI